MIQLSPRLLWIAERVLPQSVYADIGTDHGKLPIYLVQSGKIDHAFASDVSRIPVERASRNIAHYGLQSQIRLEMCDGLALADALLPTAVSICGMGGETICKILSASTSVRRGGVRLLLQPMTDFSVLRNYLAENGFAIFDEEIVRSEGRLYQCLAAEYDGAPYTLTPAEAEVGRLNIQKRSPLFLSYLERRLKIVEKCIAGRQLAFLSADAQEQLAEEYRSILSGGVQ